MKKSSTTSTHKYPATMLITEQLEKHGKRLMNMEWLREIARDKQDLRNKDAVTILHDYAHLASRVRTWMIKLESKNEEEATGFWNALYDDAKDVLYDIRRTKRNQPI